MSKRVKSSIAQRAKKPRTPRVPEQKPLKDEKAEARVTSAEKERFRAACEKRHQKMAEVLRVLALAYCEAVDADRRLDGDLEVRRKEAGNK